MKIRIYSPFFPWPVTEGAFQTISDQVRHLSLHHDVELVTWKSEGADRKLLPKSVKWLDWSRGKTKESFFKKILRVLRGMLTSDSSPELFYYPLQKDFRSELSPCDLAIYHYSFCHTWLSRKRVSSEAKVAVHFHNLESDLFFERAKSTANPLAAFIHKSNAKKLFKHELNLANLAQEIWQVSPVDMQDFARRLASGVAMNTTAEQKLRSPTYDLSEFKTRAAQTNELTFGFVGALDFYVNRASLEWLAKNVFPLMKQKSFKGKFVSVGKGDASSILAAAKDFPFYEHKGFVKDLESFWSGLSAMLVPHVVGSGVRMKMLESLARGIPVIANKAAVERIHPDLQNSVLIIKVETPEEWAKVLLSDQLKQVTNNNTSFEKALSAEHIYGDI